MFKLTVVAGPNRGSSFAVAEGETTIGRQGGNNIMLDSSKVSKRHCLIRVSDGEVLLRDEGSANGTFVNGVLTREKRLKSGDRISVGEYVFELSKAQPRQVAQPLAAGLGKVVQFRTQPPAGAGYAVPAQYNQQAYALAAQQAQPAPSGLPGLEAGVSTAPTIPTDLKGKALFYFDQHVMPFFYEANFRTEWRLIVVGLMAFFVLAALVISIVPVFQNSRQIVVRELGRRAQFMAKQIVDRNTAFMASRSETRTEVGSIDREDGVRVAVLVDMDNRIVAPQSKYNQYLVLGGEAKYAVRARDMFKKGRETGLWSELESELIVAVEPLKVYNPQQAKNVIVAMAVVSIDGSLATPSMGDMALAYSETLIFAAILAGLVVLILYRLTLKPLQILNDDIDKVLKGDMGQVTHEFRFEELNQLWDVINSALQRVSREDNAAAGGGSNSNPLEEMESPMKMLAELAPYGMVICDGDRRVLFINAQFEEISGIRSDAAVGQDIPSVARDQAFGALASDLFDRARPGGSGATDDFEFSGTPFKMHAACFGPQSGPAKLYVLAAIRSGEG